MSIISIRFRMEPIRSIAFGSISGTYMGIGTAVDNPILQFYIVNTTDANLMFSIDGVTDHFVIAASSFFLDDVSSNKGLGGGLYLSEGTRLYVKEIGTPTTGSVYFSAFYGSDS
jgi:hypothetical protein